MASHRFCQMGCGNHTPTDKARFCGRECQRADNRLRLAQNRERRRSRSAIRAVYHALARQHPDIFARLQHQVRKESQP